MTINQLIEHLQAHVAVGNGDLEVARYDSEFGVYDVIKIVATKQAPKKERSYIPYGSQDGAVVFLSIY